MNYSILPTLNAILNSLSTLFLIAGFWFVKRKQIEAHRLSMLGACGTSVLFLISYLTYHAHHGSQRFQGQGLIRPVYFTILLSHTVLAGVIAPLVIMTLVRALKGNLEKHAKLARVTFPLWLYVSVTGVVIYWMLYQMNYSG